MVKSFCIYKETLYWCSSYLDILLNTLAEKENINIQELCDQGRIEERENSFIVYVPPFFRKHILQIFNFDKKVIFRGDVLNKNKSIKRIEYVSIHTVYHDLDYDILVKEFKINE